MNVRDYGFSFFLTALRESGRLEMERIRNLALAVRAGFADKDGWNEFFKEIQSS